MVLLVKQVALKAVAALAPILRQLAKRDRNLADQLRRAATSVVLNIAEAEDSDPGNGRARLYSAAGSACESRAALALAIAFGYATEDQCATAEGLLDETCATLHRRNRPRRGVRT
jgi:four helix bundle protein